MKIKRGEIWLINLDPAKGSEIRKTRPAVVLSRSDYNQVAETVTVIPISTGRHIPSLHVFIEGLADQSHAIIPQIRVAAKQRLIKKIGKVDTIEMQEIITKLSHYLDIGG